MARKRFALALALLFVFSVIAGCSSKKPAQNTPAAQTPAPAPEKKFKVGMATDIGGLNDDSFNAAAYRGLKQAESDLKAEIKAVESKRQEDYDTNFRTLLDLQYDMVWGIGFLMADAVKNNAAKHPNTKWGIIDGVVEGSNVASVVFKEEEGSFLMGVMAAKTTKSKKVGFIGGMDIDVIHHFEAGFKAGVKATDPSVEVITVYSGKFDDPIKGKNDALAVHGKGADVIFHAAGFTGNGVAEAAKEKKFWFIGVDSDQKKLAPDLTLSSMMKRVDVAVFEISKMAKENKFPGGKVTVLGLKESGVGYSDTTAWDKMPADTRALVDKWAAAIKAGTVTVPNNMKKFQEWQVPKL